MVASLATSSDASNRRSRYSEAGQSGYRRCSDNVPYGAEGFLGGAYLFVGQPERYSVCRAQLTRSRDTNIFATANLVIALAITGSADDAMAAANGLIDAAEATGNPLVLSCALIAYGWPSTIPIQQRA